MPAPNADLSDLDKIRRSLGSIGTISSFDDLLAAFGLADMPPAHRVGILFGFLTFALTVCAVFALLTLGGSWKRIEAQSRGGPSATAPRQPASASDWHRGGTGCRPPPPCAAPRSPPSARPASA